jgi:hypothetical protein
MLIKETNAKVTSGLHALPPRDIKLAISVAVSAATLYVFFIAFETYRRIELIESGVFIDTTIPNMQKRIGLALIVSAVGLWSRRGVGLLISALALLWVGKEYLSWHLYSREFLSALNVSEFSQLHPEAVRHHAGNLVYATSWDLIVLIVTVVLFAWEVKTLAGILIRSRGNVTPPLT